MGNIYQTPALESARQASQMIGQEVALEQIRQAIYAEDKRFKIAFVLAEGGMGKTRLLEEISEKVTTEWASLGIPATCQLIDVIDIRLQDRNRFIRELRNAYPDPFDFREYESAEDEVVLLRASGAQLAELRRAERKAIEAFLKDLTIITQKRRVVWIIDTVEQLSYITSEWLLENKLLQSKDLENRTHQWLKDLIVNPDLNNITLILAGRGLEGESFFNSIHEAVKQANENELERELIDVNLVPLSRAETRSYFHQLSDDWQTSDQINVDNLTRKRIVAQFELIASEKNDRADVLWLYTAGIPVRLALYAQIIIEGYSIPKPLRYSFKQAVNIAGTDNPQNSTPELMRLQWEVEDQFINVLFRNPTDLRARILQVLVRAPRGLSAEQLHFILDNKDKLSPSQWQKDIKRLNEITKLLFSMQNYYLVKRRSSWTDISNLQQPEEQEAVTFRLGLQDEIYRIYAEHMAPHEEPIQAEVFAIWEELGEREKERYRKNREFEKKEREDLYKQLSTWSEFQHYKYLNEKQKIMAADERQLELSLVPDRPRTFYFEQLGTNQISLRTAINEAIETFKIETMVYKLLQNIERRINEEYIDLGTDTNKSKHGDLDFWAQLEMWRMTHDKYILKFADFAERQQAVDHGETMVDVLHRAVTQEDVSRWIKRFVLRSEYARAISFAERVEVVIQSMPQKTKLEKRIWYSWNHSLACAERALWTQSARIYLSEDVPAVIAQIQAQIGVLFLLLNRSVQQVAIVREDGHKENGFKGAPDENIPDHPAYVRVKRLLSVAHNMLGYGYISIGQVRNAVNNYGRALYYIRGDKGVAPHRGYVLNNLSKALSDMGRTSTSVCVDGLNLRRELAEEVPLAISYNTLALIYDDMDRYEDAPELAAKAIAYLRRAGADRGLAMALMQLGESLRHLAIRAQRGEKAQATPDSLYAASESLLREAKGIFSRTGEISRFIMVLIEIGSIYRDRLRSTPDGYIVPKRQRENHYREAIINLNEAMKMAKDKRLQHLEVDAGVNLAWAHYHMAQYQEAARVITSLEENIPETYFITQTTKPDVEDDSLVDIFWVLRQFSKLQLIRGQSALSQFSARRHVLSQKFPNEIDVKKRHLSVHDDLETQQFLKQVAKSYTLAVGYAYILSSGGRMVDFLLDDLYDRLKAFNHQELDDFHGYVIVQSEKYKHLASAHVLNRFLHEFFGVLGQGDLDPKEA